LVCMHGVDSGDTLESRLETAERRGWRVGPAYRRLRAAEGWNGSRWAASYARLRAGEQKANRRKRTGVAADFKRRTAQGCEELRERLGWGVKGRHQDFWRWAFKAKRARKRERVRSKRKRGLTILENFKQMNSNTNLNSNTQKRCISMYATLNSYG
jgi:hypothetical protein